MRKEERELQERIREFKDLIAEERHTSSHEAELQSFLEANPFMLPNIHSSHYCPESGKVVRKPPLGDFIPDFAFSCVNSLGRTYVLVEIEDPCKKIFTAKDSFTSAFQQAEQQVKDWYGAFEEIGDRLAAIFRGARALSSFNERHMRTHLKCYLVIGRRGQIDTSQKRQDRWAAEGNSLGESIEIMTYDRLLDTAAPWVRLGHRKTRTYSYRDKKLSRVQK